MKLQIFFTSLVALIIFTSISCDRDRMNDDEMTEEEALEIVQSSLVSEAYGVQIQADDASSLNSTENSESENCGLLNTRMLERNSIANATVSYSYSISYLFSLVCETNQSRYFTIDFEGNGMYSSPRFESDDTISYEAELTNISSSESFYLYNGSFSRIGTQTTRIAGRTKNFNSTLLLESTNISIDKSSRTILGGATGFSLTGNLNSGDSFSFVGDIVYNGNDSATVTLNGTSYNVSL